MNNDGVFAQTSVDSLATEETQAPQEPQNNVQKKKKRRFRSRKGMVKKTYSDEFKKIVLELYNQGVSATKLAGKFGVHQTTISAWAKDPRLQRLLSGPEPENQQASARISIEVQQPIDVQLIDSSHNRIGVLSLDEKGLAFTKIPKKGPSSRIGYDQLRILLESGLIAQK